MNEMLFSLGLIALLTSMLSAVTGVGGGVLLLSGLTLYLPPQALVPIHGAIQTWSCGVRLALFWQQIDWRLIPPFLSGMLHGLERSVPKVTVETKLAFQEEGERITN